jgi:tRNA nucleotidyltransferase (CCA-adding enzyme)
MEKFTLNIPNSLQVILNKLNSLEIVPLLVGGMVRDLVRFKGELPEGYTADFDIELWNTSKEVLDNILGDFGKVAKTSVGAVHFPVWKLTLSDGTEVDFSLPRAETKIFGTDRKGFEVTLIENSSLCEMTFRKAASRRDFTCNAMGLDLVTLELWDLFGGVKDIKEEVLRAVSETAFMEDPLRVLRAARFAARFRFRIDRQIFKLSNKVSNLITKEVSLERFEKEIQGILKTRFPVWGIGDLIRLGVLKVHPSICGTFLDRLSALKELNELNLSTFLVVAARMESNFDWLKMPFDKQATKTAKQLEAFLTLLLDVKDDLKTEKALFRWFMTTRNVDVMQVVKVATAFDFIDPKLSLNILDHFISGNLEPKINASDILALNVPEGPKIGKLLNEMINIQAGEPALSRQALLNDLKELV